MSSCSPGLSLPFVATQVVAVVGPMAIIVGIYLRRRNVYDLHHAILGKLRSLALAAILVPILFLLEYSCVRGCY